MSRNLHVFLFGLLLTGISAPGHSQETNAVHPYLSDTFFVDVGVFFPDRRLGLSVNGSNGEIHELIEFEEEARFKKRDDIFALEFGWRFGERWRLVGQYFESSDDTSWILEEDVEWEDVVFEAGSNVAGGVHFLLIRAFMGRDFNVGEKHEFGLGAGLHWLDIGAYLEGTVIIGDGGTAFARESVGVSAPLPNIGVWYNYSIAERWAFRTRFDLFSADIGKYDGTLINFSAGVDYQVSRHFGFGLNYNHFELDVKVDNSDWNGRVKTSYEGLYVDLSFYW